MKVSRIDKATFVPVVLTLESQGEVDLIYSLLSETYPVNIENVFGVDSHTMYQKIQPYADREVTTESTIKFKE